MSKKILWASCDPSSPSGYGIVTKDISYILNKLGYEVWNWGVNVHGVEHERKYEDRSYKMCSNFKTQASAWHDLPNVVKKYRPDATIFLYDIWPFPGKFLSSLGRNVVAYVPLDGTLHRESAGFYSRALAGVNAIAFTRWAQLEFKNHGIRADYIPHPYDARLFKPLSNKSELRRKYDIPVGAFVIGYVAKNGERKDLPAAFEVFKRLKETIPNCMFYLHTAPDAVAGGAYGVGMLCSALGIRGGVITPEQEAYCTDEELNELYNCMDVYFTTSQAEGFGLPIIQSQAAGIAAVTPRNSAQGELGTINADCSGYNISLTNPLHSVWPRVDVDSMVDQIHNLYKNPMKSEDVTKLVTKYELENVGSMWDTYLTQLIGE